MVIDDSVTSARKLFGHRDRCLALQLGSKVGDGDADGFGGSVDVGIILEVEGFVVIESGSWESEGDHRRQAGWVAHARHDGSIKQ